MIKKLKRYTLLTLIDGDKIHYVNYNCLLDLKVGDEINFATGSEILCPVSDGIYKVIERGTEINEGKNINASLTIRSGIHRFTRYYSLKRTGRMSS